MIQEYVREMTTDERASLQGAMRPEPARARRPTLRSIEPETWGLALVAVLTLAVIALAGGSRGGLAIAAAAGVLVGGYQLAAAARRNARRREFGEAYAARRHRELVRVLEDGRATVKRVRAVAVVEIEPFEDEGPGYVFDLGDGRVLFVKGQDFSLPDDEDSPWPNTDFEIVRAATDGTMLGLRCHGTALRPLRVVPAADVDPQKGWDEREEVLQMSVDEAVRTVLLKP